MTGATPVLVVENDADLRDRLRILLHQEGFAVETATDGRDALDQLEAGLRPCVIVMDLMMPVMNGFEFRSEQLKDPTLARIPVITYSGIGDVRARPSGSVGSIGTRQPKDIDGIL